MTEKIITHVCVAVAVGLALSYLQKGAGRQEVSAYTGHFLRMNKFYAVIAVVSIVLGLIIDIMLILGKEFILTLLPILIFWLPAVFCFLYYKNHYLKFNESTIEVRSWLGKQQIIHWAEIQNISFNHLSGLLTITDKNGVEVKIHQHIVGLISFVNMMEGKTSWTAKGLRLPIQ